MKQGCVTYHYEGAPEPASFVELADELRESVDGLDNADGDMGLAVAEVGVRPPLRDRSIGDATLWVSTDTAELEERVRRMYGRGGSFCASCGDVATGEPRSRSDGTLSEPYSSTKRGGGRSTIASRSCITSHLNKRHAEAIRMSAPPCATLRRHIRLPSLLVRGALRLS